MAMAQVTSSDHKAFSSVSAYLRNPAHLVSSASVPADFTSQKYLMDAAADCPVSWPMPDQFLPSEIKLQQGTSFPSDNPHALSGPIPNTDWQQFIDPSTVAYSSALVPPGAVTSALLSNAAEVTKLANGSLSYTPSPGRPSPGVDRGSSTWATSNLTVDPSKGGLALQGSSSQCFAEFPSDPGFAERAARYSSSMGYGQHSPNKLSRTSSMRGDNNATEEAVKSALDEGKLFSKLHKVSQEAGRSPSKEDSLSSAQNSMEQGSNRKRKSNEDKCKDVTTRKTESEDTKSKRQKASEGSKDEGKAKTEKSSSENSGSTSPKSAKENPKPPEPPKQDYIHVRARRGQATDSHSLAERVRREKISERMKFLQDLVPGCSKVTGKAVMLDEIINYVQSLQRQVEFLSMKLAAVNPRLDINLDNLLTKEILQSRAAGSPVVLNHDGGSNYLHIPQLQHAQQGVMQLGTCGLDLRSLSSVENAVFGDSGSQTSTVWDGELQSVVQMSFGALAQELQGHLPAGHMKVEI